MDKLELSKIIKERIVIIGTILNHLNTITKYCKNNSLFESGFTVIFVSLQSSLYIELFKIFDTGKDTKNYNIYKLIELLEDDEKDKCRYSISVYRKEIKSIKTRRNHVFAHYTNESPYKNFSENLVNNKIEEIIQCIANICCIANPELYPNIYVSNANDFNKWCKMAIDSINEAVERNNKCILTNWNVSK